MSLTNPDVGLQSDANTLALYKSIQEYLWNVEDGTTHNDSTCEDKSGNGWTLTVGAFVFGANGPLGREGWFGRPAAERQFSRYLHAAISGVVQSSAVVDTTIGTAAREDHTIQVMFRWEWDLGAFRGLHAAAGNSPGAGVTNDYVDRIAVNTNGTFHVFTENTDTNVGTNSSGGLLCRPGFWQVLTLRFTVLNSTQHTVDFFVHTLEADGSVSGGYDSSGTGLRCATNSGTNDGRITYGAVTLGSTDYVGAIGYGRFIKRAMLDAEINAQAEELLTQGLISAAGDDVELYRHEFNEMPRYIDEGPYGMHGYGGSTVDPHGDAPNFVDLIGSGGRARSGWGMVLTSQYPYAYTLMNEFGKAAPVRTCHWFTNDLRAVPEWTIQWWGLRMGEAAGSWFMNQASGESETTNHVLSCPMGTSGGIGWFSERGSGVNVTLVNTAGSWDGGVLTQLQPTLYTIRCGPKAGAPSTCQLRISINDDLDVWVGDLSAITTGGESNTHLSAFFGGTHGLCQEIKWSKVAISDQQIIDDYARVAIGGPAGSLLAIDSVTVVDPVTIDVTFTGVVQATAQVSDLTNYQILGIDGAEDLAVTAVTQPSTNVLRLTVSEMLTGATYEVRVFDLQDDDDVFMQQGPDYNEEQFVGAGAAPTAVLVTPVTAVGAPSDTDIVFDVTDLHSGVDLSTVVIRIDGAEAYANNAFGTGFKGSRSKVETIANGYRITVDPQRNFLFSDVIDIELSASDNVGNELT